MTEMITMQGFNALSKQQQKAHRIEIGLRAKAILSVFWEDKAPDAVKAIEVEGWMDVLQNCSQSEIREAWADYQRDGDNRSARGRLVKPDAGALYRIILRKRPKPKLVETPEEPREPPCSFERAAEIMQQVGFRPKGFGEGKA